MCSTHRTRPVHCYTMPCRAESSPGHVSLSSQSLGFPEPIPEPAPPPPPEPALDGPAKPAWRVVHKRPERMAKGKAKAPAALPAPPPPPPEPPKADLPSWAQWRRAHPNLLIVYLSSCVEADGYVSVWLLLC